MCSSLLSVISLANLQSETCLCLRKSLQCLCCARDPLSKQKWLEFLLVGPERFPDRAEPGVASLT